ASNGCGHGHEFHVGGFCCPSWLRTVAPRRACHRHWDAALRRRVRLLPFRRMGGGRVTGVAFMPLLVPPAVPPAVLPLVPDGLAILLGTVAGCLYGLVPGLHANTAIAIAALVAPASPLLALALAAGTFAHLMVAILPATFVGVPD